MISIWCPLQSNLIFVFIDPCPIASRFHTQKPRHTLTKRKNWPPDNSTKKKTKQNHKQQTHWLIIRLGDHDQQRSAQTVYEMHCRCACGSHPPRRWAHTVEGRSQQAKKKEKADININSPVNPESSRSRGGSIRAIRDIDEECELLVSMSDSKACFSPPDVRTLHASTRRRPQCILLYGTYQPI